MRKTQTNDEIKQRNENFSSNGQKDIREMEKKQIKGEDKEEGEDRSEVI